MMSAKFHRILAVISLCFFIACKTDHEIKIDYPTGGYEYPKYVDDKDTTFYYYPLKDLLSTKDSFKYSNEYYYFYKIFNENNLSIKSAEKTTFRLTYLGPMVSSVIIVLTQTEIIVKKRIKGWVSPGYDSTKLTNTEKIHYELLTWLFPLNDTSYSKRRRVYVDSLSKVYPELLDPKYYKYLLDKSADYIGFEKFEFTTKRIPISNMTFHNLINKINKSGYWEFPFFNICKDPPTDGDGFALEANTPKKYNIVIMPVCPGISSKYTKACQALVKYAQLEKEIDLNWEYE